MIQLDIDPDELIQALTFSMDISGASWYLDRETGQVLLDHEDSENLPEGFEDDPRYISIQQLPSHQAYEAIRNFVDGLPEGRAADALQRALEGRKPFRHFKDTLLDYPEIREAWFQFEHEAQLRMAAEWCRDYGIEPVWRKHA